MSFTTDYIATAEFFERQLSNYSKDSVIDDLIRVIKLGLELGDETYLDKWASLAERVLKKAQEAGYCVR